MPGIQLEVRVWWCVSITTWCMGTHHSFQCHSWRSREQGGEISNREEGRQHDVLAASVRGCEGSLLQQPAQHLLLPWKLVNKEKAFQHCPTLFLFVLRPKCVVSSVKSSFHQVLVGNKEQWGPSKHKVLQQVHSKLLCFLNHGIQHIQWGLGLLVGMGILFVSLSES